MRELARVTRGFVDELAVRRVPQGACVLRSDSEYGVLNTKHDEFYKTLKSMLDEKGRQVLLEFDDVWCDMALKEEEASYRQGFRDAQGVSKLLSSARFGAGMDEDATLQEVAPSVEAVS